MPEHALLSASSASRWRNCPPSARLEQQLESRVSDAASEGTAAYALAEHKLRRAINLDAIRPSSSYETPEMEEYTDGYAAFVLDLLSEARKTCPDALLLIEQRLDFSARVPQGFGTGDALIVADDTLHIIDLKYGQGIQVQADHNPQMMLHALGALNLFGGLYDIQTVHMTIYQPAKRISPPGRFPQRS